ncbi:MAG: hypothetical protein KAR45_17140, partial [Desulfobacteraceae bacterium]|nr:hypothetical protein [Desulfobacteraceae bacterium]
MINALRLEQTPDFCNIDTNNSNEPVDPVIWNRWAETKLNILIMTKKQQKKTTTIPTNLIAPCGMNCRLCW